MSFRICMIAAISACMLTSCSKNEFPYLYNPPDQWALPGTYVLVPDSVTRLQEMGYSQFNAKITIKGDGTFEASSMPGDWIDDVSSKHGYDNCSGTWKPEGLSDRYFIILTILKFSADSAFNSNGNFKGHEPPLIFLGIADRTPERKQYALAVLLNNEDDGCLIFVK